MAHFPTELGILTCLAIFAASMLLPYVIGMARLPEVEGVPDGFVRPANVTKPFHKRALGSDVLPTQIRRDADRAFGAI